MAACTVEIAFTTPLGVYSIVINATYQMVPYISWENIHEDFSYVDQIPTVVLQSSPSTVLALESSRWSYVLCAFVLFVFFGWGRDAREAYGRTFQTLFRHVGLRSIRSASRNITARALSVQATACSSFPAQPRGDSVPPILPNISFEDLPVFASQSDVDFITGSDVTTIV